MSAQRRHHRVYVLGAGFTKAFIPDAPLLVDDYGCDELAGMFDPFPVAADLLNLERRRDEHGKINIERLMTRLDGGMPYDTEHEQHALRLLLTELQRRFIDRINHARADKRNWDALMAFARHCIENNIGLITFNHDDALDEALWTVKAVCEVPVPEPKLYWHPDGGYGFFCRPSVVCVADTEVFMDESSLLVKLHGSINWRARLGARRPYAVDEIVHHEDWLPLPRRAERVINRAAIESHLEADRFIVPPVLIKAALIEQPILRLVWTRARKELARATQVTFVGYSMPVTDIAAQFLFGEALQHIKPEGFQVVNIGDDPDRQSQLKGTYRLVFPNLEDAQFDFNGAMDWARRVSGP